MTADLPAVAVDILRRDWPRIMRADAMPPVRLVTTGTVPTPAALLARADLAEQVAAAHGAHPIPSYDTTTALELLGDLIYRAQRLQQPTAVRVHGRQVAALLPLAWAQDIPAGLSAPLTTTPEGIEQ